MTNKTYLFDQMYVAFNSVTENYQKDVFYIIFSDGEDNASETEIDDVLNSYKLGIVYSIDFSIGNKRNYRTNILEDIAKKSNGEYYKADDATELAEYFKKIAQKIIFSGYEITYKEFFPPKISQTGIFSLEANTYKSVDKIKIEEIKSKEFYPLLNYIFFDKNSSDLSDRYSVINKNDCSLFEEKNLPPDQLCIYHNLLNILGKRLILNEDIKIKLVGCNDNNGNEKNNLALSGLRAEFIKNYLRNSWNIAPERITVKCQNLPQKPSNTKHICGQEENRRVEIVCDNPALFDPVVIETDTKIGEPGNLQFQLTTRYSSEPGNWKIFINQKENNLFQAEGKDYPPDYISWNVNESIKNKAVDSSSLDIFINLKDKKGLESEIYCMHLPVKYLSSFQKKTEKFGDKFIEKLSLVLFDFNSSALSKRNKNILLKVENAVTNCSRLNMIGYTDSIGTEQSNSKLSQQRASNALRELIKTLKPAAMNLNSEGYGESVPLYDNSTPEGRFYNRTCQLIIETSLKVD
jgi:outer membrane protein OmpA-like peptidoglycan-associated protein